MLRLIQITAIIVLGLAPLAHGIVLVEVTEIDMGYVYRDEPQELVFELRNASPDTLLIYDVEPSCDCTTAEVVPGAIGPDETGRVLVFFDPMGYENRGRFQEYVRLSTSDRETPEIMLTFSIDIGIGPEPEPRALQFGSICRGESDTLVVSINPAPGKDLTIIEARGDTVCLAVERAGEGDGGSQAFRVIATNVEGCGRVATFITFDTSDELRPRLRIPVSVSLAGSIVAEPGIIAFGPTLPGSQVSQVVKIVSRKGKKFKVSTVASSIEGIVPEVTMTGDASCELRLRIRDDASPGQVSGSISVSTGCPDEPPLDIKVNGYIRKDTR